MCVSNAVCPNDHTVLIKINVYGPGSYSEPDQSIPHMVATPLSICFPKKDHNNGKYKMHQPGLGACGANLSSPGRVVVSYLIGAGNRQMSEFQTGGMSLLHTQCSAKTSLSAQEAELGHSMFVTTTGHLNA